MLLRWALALTLFGFLLAGRSPFGGPPLAGGAAAPTASGGRCAVGRHGAPRARGWWAATPCLLPPRLAPPLVGGRRSPRCRPRRGPRTRPPTTPPRCPCRRTSP